MDFVQTEQEQLERSLFIHLINLAPDGTSLLITNDSWDGLPNLLGSYLKVEEGAWRVALTPSARKFLVYQAQMDDVQAKFVHFWLVRDEITLLASFDRMAAITLNETFPDYQKLATKYASLLMF